MPEGVVGELAPAALVHYGALVDYSADDVDEEGDYRTVVSVSVHLSDFVAFAVFTMSRVKGARRETGGKSKSKTHMTAKTPLGPTCCFSICTAGQAALLLASKKYVHSSLVPTNAMLTFGAVGSLSHSKLMSVDLRRLDQLSGLDWSRRSVPSLGQGEPFVKFRVSLRPRQIRLVFCWLEAVC